MVKVIPALDHGVFLSLFEQVHSWCPILAKEGDLVFLNKSGILPKLALVPTRAGPHLIVKVHDNGTVTIAKSMTITDKASIRRLQPYYHKEPEWNYKGTVRLIL